LQLAARTRDDPLLVRAWDVVGGAEVAAFRGHTLPVFCVRFSGDGRRLLTCAYDLRRGDRPHEIKVWDAASGAALATFSGRGQLFNAAFSPDGRRLALGAQDGTVLLIDWERSRRVVAMTGHKSHVSAVAFSPDGRRLASAELEEGVVKLWELEAEGAHEAAALPSPGLLCDLTFSPDGRRLAGITRDLVLMWDVETGQEVLTLRGAPQRHWDPAFNPRVTFSPDGQRLAGTNWDETISLWEADAPVDDGELARRQTARRQAAKARAPLWHLEEAEDCLDHNNRRAALFHLRRIEGLPLPSPLEALRDRLARRLRP
jgi:WD40 repeat protein